MTDYAEVLNAMRPFKKQDIFCVGPFATRVSFSGQQYRAFALLHALYRERAAGSAGKRESIFSGQKVAIIGCSITGMTIAAGLSKMGAEVKIFERSANNNHYLFNSNPNRFVHPNINFIPLESLSFTVDLPFMYWWAGAASNIYRNLYQELVKCGLDEKIAHGTEVGYIVIDRHRAEDNRKKYTLAYGGAGAAKKHDIQSEYDKVFICTGFSSERNHPGFINQSYWKPFRDVTGIDNFCVLGKGDGGIIDAIYYGCEWTTENIFHSAMKFDEKLRELSGIFRGVDVVGRDDEEQLEALKQKISSTEVFNERDRKRFKKVAIFGFLDQSKPNPAVWHRFILWCAGKERFITEIDLSCRDDFVNRKENGASLVEYKVDHTRAPEVLEEKSTIVEVRLGADHDVAILKETYQKNPYIELGAGAEACVNHLKDKESLVSPLLISRREIWSSDSDFIGALSVDVAKKRTDARSALMAWTMHCRAIFEDENLDLDLEDFGDRYHVFIKRSKFPEKIKMLPGLNGKIFNIPVDYSDIPDKSHGGIRNGLVEF